MTKLDLLARAKALGITGRHDMSKADLETAVTQREMIQQVSDAAKQAQQEIKAESKPVRRRGSNLNTPWQRKYYYVSQSAYDEAKTEGRVAKAPMQVQLLLKFMVERGITEFRQAQQGSSIATVAVSSGFVKTVIEPHVLFAYYRSKMEQLGLVFAGYNVGEGDEESDPEAEAEAADEAALEAEAEDDGE
jgi:hypothetical protein